MALRICIDPGHGMSNRKRGVFDPGAVVGKVREADIAMDWANQLRDVLTGMGHTVVRTRVDHKDPAPVWRRDDVAAAYKCQRMISLHCNCSDDARANGTETFFRGEDDRALAEKLTAAVCGVLGTRNRGAKTERESQHTSLAVMEFDKCWLVELGFLSHEKDRVAMLDAGRRRQACLAIARVLVGD